jgi:4-methyl-5(b-hydroxyethyl)-thiazole monophosphate biosynthesis
MFNEAATIWADAIVLPGGMPGTLNLLAHQDLCNLIRNYHDTKKPVCAICAAPLILGALNLLRGKTATIYPGMENKLVGAIHSENPVCVDGNIITSRGPGTAIPFALKLVEILAGKETAERLKADIVYPK